MGWSSGHRPQGQSVLDFIKEDMGLDSPDCGWKLIGHSINISRAWLVLRCDKEGDHRLGQTHVEEVLIHHSRGWWNTTIKEVEESMGPCDIDLPRRLWDMLDPTFNLGEHSEAWRERVKARLDRMEAYPSLKAGDTVKFSAPVSFVNGAELDTLIYAGKGNQFSAGWSGRYRLPRDWKSRYQWTVEPVRA